jgi:hypothetical protein
MEGNMKLASLLETSGFADMFGKKEIHQDAQIPAKSHGVSVEQNEAEGAIQEAGGL